MRRVLVLLAALAAFPAVAHGATPKVVARGIPFATNVVFDPAGGMWVTSGAGGSNASDGVWYVPKGGKPRHVVRHGGEGREGRDDDQDAPHHSPVKVALHSRAIVPAIQGAPA